MLALPRTPADSSPAAVLAGIQGSYNLVYAYEACDATDPWKKFDPTAPPFVNDLAELGPGKGYWVRMMETGTLIVGS